MGIRARLWPGLRPRGIALEAVIAGLVLAGLVVNAVTSGYDPLPAWLALAGAVAVPVLLLVWRRTTPLVPYVGSLALTVAYEPATLAVLATAYAVGRYTGPWAQRAACAVVGVVVVSHFWTLDTAVDIANAVAGAVFTVLLPGALGAWARTRAALVAALTDRAERAEAERELMAREAVLTERTRIAREMHDAVGHRVSLMVLQAGAIEVAAADRDRVEQLAGQVQAAGRQALEELRQMVGVLRADDAMPLAPQPGLESVGRLVEESREAGMDVELRAGDEVAVNPSVGRAAYRVVQEALTNAAKHAPGARVRVELDRREAELVVRVVNGPGREPAADAPSGGYGLVGLGERVRTLDGQLATGRRLDGGFAVEAVLPA